MRIRRISAAAVCLSVFFLYLSPLPVYAEMTAYPSWGFSVDMPEGFKLVKSDGATRFIFQQSAAPVGVQIAVYPYSQFSTAEQLAGHVVRQLQGKKRSIAFTFHDIPALLSHLSFGAGRNQQAGWLLTFLLPNQKGWLAVLSSTPHTYSTEYEPLMISVLDSLFLESYPHFEPGPVTQALYPKERLITVTGIFGGKSIPFYFDAVDSEANQAVIDREFSLLTRYLHSPLLEAAWKRYYRAIYRDSVSRCRYIPMSIEKTLIRSSRTGMTAPSTRETAESILAWLQGFSYTRTKNAADFINLPEVCGNSTGDCDSRALLMAVILNQMNIDTILLISAKHKHAVAAVDCEGEGARFMHKGKHYLIAETTASVPLGLIAKDFADISDWFAVDWD